MTLLILRQLLQAKNKLLAVPYNIALAPLVKKVLLH
jgi:hypothetical protein